MVPIEDGWGALLAIVASLANLLGYELTASDQVAIVDQLTTVVGAVGGLLALYGRISASKRLG